MAKKSTLRPVLLWAGAILSVIGNVAVELGYTNGSVATVVGIVVALIGCYLWTRDKNRAWGFALWGLLVPIGYLAIMPLKDRSAKQS